MNKLDESKTRRPAVAAPNLSVATHYSYNFVDQTRAIFSTTPSSTSTLFAGEINTHTADAEITGTFPLLHSLGVRGRVRGSYHYAEIDLGPVNSGSADGDSGSYGVAAEIFLRDPDLGSLTIGSSWDRIDGDPINVNQVGEDTTNVNRIGANASASIFFPDFGAGSVDWFAQFNYQRLNYSGAGISADSDDDRYEVVGGAGWYLTENSRVIFGARWLYAENGRRELENLEGLIGLRWLLPLPIPAELSLDGSMGISSFNLISNPSNDRRIYGASVGLTFRFGSGPTLIEMIRAYD